MSRPLVPARRRLPALGLVAVCAVLVGTLGVLLAGRTGTHPDAVVERALAMHTGLAREVGRVLANVGDPIPVAVAMLGLLWFGHARDGRRGLVFAAVAPLTAMTVTSLVLKPLIDRTRGGELAFPSGHTSAVTSMAATAAIIVLASPDLSRRWRWSALGGAVALSVGVAISMTGRGYHYPSDSFGGLAVGTGVVLAVALIVDRVTAPSPAPAGQETVTAPEAPTQRLPRGVAAHRPRHGAS